MESALQMKEMQQILDEGAENDEQQIENLESMCSYCLTCRGHADMIPHRAVSVRRHAGRVWQQG